MRLAIVATPALLTDQRPAPGALDGDVLRARLPLYDTAFDVHDLDPAVDVAQQLEELFDLIQPSADDAVLFYASCPVVLTPAGELFLCLDPKDPDTGDALEDIVAVFRERITGPALFVLECRHRPDPGDPFASANVAGAGRTLVAPAESGIELLVAASPLFDETVDESSAFTRALVASLDDVEPGRGLTAAELYEQIHESEVLLGVVPSFAYGRGRVPFALVPGEPTERLAVQDLEATTVDARPGGSAAADDDEVQARAADDEDETAEAGPADREEGASEPPRLSVQDLRPAYDDDEEDEGREGRDERDEREAEADAESTDPEAAAAHFGTREEDRHEREHERDDAPAGLEEPTDEADVPIDTEEEAGEEDEEEEREEDEEEEREEDEEEEREEDEEEEREGGDDSDGELRSVEPGPADDSTRASVRPMALPDDRSFTKPLVDLPRVIVSDRPPPPAAPVGTDGDVVAVPRASEPVKAAVAPAEEPPAKTPSSPPAKTPSSPPAKTPSSPPAKTPSSPPAKTPSSPPAKTSSSPPAAAIAASPASASTPEATPLGADVASGKVTPATEQDAEPSTPEEYVARASRVTDSDPEAALRDLRAALGMLASGSRDERASIYVRMADCKRRQGKRREAISNLEKALGLVSTERSALEALVELDFEERDKRGLAAAEDRLLAVVGDDDRPKLLIRWGARWQDELRDGDRARKLFERARESVPRARVVHERLAVLYRADGDLESSLAARRSVAELTTDGAGRARLYYELGKECLHDLGREEEALTLFDHALDADPSLLEPLELVAAVLAERMEYGELERAYRRMLDRIHRAPPSVVRTEVSWELCRRLGMLFRDHLEDQALALDAFEDALDEKPNDLPTLLAAAELARGLQRHETAALHLQAAARLDSGRLATFHDLFELFQRLRRPDLAYCAACVTSLAGEAEARERFVFDEHKPESVPKLSRALRPEAWELLRATHDEHLEAILTAVAPAAIAVRLAELAKEGRLPALDPATRQDPDKSTASIVRSFTWASHFLGVPAPAVYVRDEAALGLAAVPTEEPTVIAGGGVLRGRSLADLAFLVGRHLVYYRAPNRLLLFYPSLEDLSACFVAAVKIALPGIPVPKPLQPAVSALRPAIDKRLDSGERDALERAAASFEEAGTRADLAAWVASVERCSTRAGFLLAGSLPVAQSITTADPRGVLSAEEKMRDLCGWLVSDAHHLLREELGIAIQP